MKTLIFDETMFGMIEITLFNPNTGDGVVYFHQNDIEVSMLHWRFNDLYQTQYLLSLDTFKKEARLTAWLPKVIGKIKY